MYDVRCGMYDVEGKYKVLNTKCEVRSTEFNAGVLLCTSYFVLITWLFVLNFAANKYLCIRFMVFRTAIR
jgi:hypothetical protein